MTQITLSPVASIPARYANRHGLVTGPTGTGKTISIMRLIESFVAEGVAVFAPDVKGDLGALARSCPSIHWQPLRGRGKPARVPVWALGADLLSRALELTDAQAGALEIAFAYADETDCPLDTLSDFRALLAALANSPDLVAHLGHVTRASIGTIQRALLRLEGQGAGALFGAPAFDIENIMGEGVLSILDASQLYHAPRLYGAFLLYILRDLARRLPECGDMDRPRLVMIFDEAHTLFHEASPALLRSIEATARLIRSKGVGLYFASQSPQDIPEIIVAQCSTTITHAREYGVGKALFQTLDHSGRPTAARMIRPSMPRAPLGPLSSEELPPIEVEKVAASNGDPLVNTLAAGLLIATVIAIGAGAYAVWSGHLAHVAGAGVGLWVASRIFPS